MIGEVELPDVDVLVSYMGLMTHASLGAVIRYGADGRPDSSFGEGQGYVLTDLGQPPTYGTSVPYRKALTTLTSGAIDGNGSVVALGGIGEFPCSRAIAD